MTSKQTKLPKGSKMTVAHMTKIAILSGIAVLLQFLDFALPIFPSFLQIDFSDVPALLAAFAMGPLAGVAVELIKNILHLLITTTGGVGEIANFVIGCALVVPAALVYRKHKTKKGAILGLSLGVIVMTIVGGFMNYYVLLPFYGNFMPMDAIIAMGNVVYSGIVDMKTLVLYGVTPFNIFKGVLVAIVTLIIYKKVSPILHDK